MVVCRIARCVQVGGVHIQIMGKLSRKPPTRVTRGALYPGHTIPYYFTLATLYLITLPWRGHTMSLLTIPPTMLYHKHLSSAYIVVSIGVYFTLTTLHIIAYHTHYPHANRNALYHVHQYSVQPTTSVSVLIFIAPSAHLEYSCESCWVFVVSVCFHLERQFGQKDKDS